MAILSNVSWIIDVLFENKVATTCLVVAWMLFTCCLFYSLGAFHMQFMTFGPSAHTTFMGMVIDSWVKWGALACFSFLNTAMNEFLDSALAPWFTNTIQVLLLYHTTPPPWMPLHRLFLDSALHGLTTATNRTTRPSTSPTPSSPALP